MSRKAVFTDRVRPTRTPDFFDAVKDDSITSVLGVPAYDGAYNVFIIIFLSCSQTLI